MLHHLLLRSKNLLPLVDCHDGGGNCIDVGEHHGIKVLAEPLVPVEELLHHQVSGVEWVEAELWSTQQLLHEIQEEIHQSIA